MLEVVTRFRIAFFALIAGLALVAVPVVAQDDGEGGGGGTPSCIDYEAIARYRAYGYDHVVRVTNGCDERARCEVWTSVTPEKHHVDLRPDETEEVLTRTGSPAREFTPRVSCELAD